MFERLGRVNHGILGPCVRMAATIDRQRMVMLFPVDQSKGTQHKKHLNGYGEDGQYRLCLSPTVSFHGDLCRYAQFKWPAGKEFRL
ncbi:MAG: hypothetical protein QM690_16020 [Sphingobium sp.]